MKPCSILSVRNLLRTSGIVAMCVGAPMIIVPPLLVQMFYGKREDTSEADKKAHNLTMQALGVALTASGVKSLIAPVSKQALGAALYMEALFSCYHIRNRCFGRIKDAKGNLDVSMMLLCANLLVVTAQALSLCCGDDDDEEDEGKED